MKRFENLEFMQSFSEKNLPSLSKAVLGALELFEKEGVPKIDFGSSKKIVVFGSGNAINTNRIIFSGRDAVFLDENNYLDALNIKHDMAFILSASGEKHGRVIADFCKENKIKTKLITCNPKASSIDILGRSNVIISPKNREPYTYNTSTYLGLILGMTREDPKKIREFIVKKVEPLIEGIFSKPKGFVIVVPDKFSLIMPLYDIKFKELFGRNVPRDISTYGGFLHAVDVVPSKDEVCIAIGDGELDFQGMCLRIPIPKNADYGFMMALGYYIIGRVQEDKSPYFKKNIKAYIERMNKKKFGKGLKVIVE